MSVVRYDIFRVLFKSEDYKKVIKSVMASGGFEPFEKRVRGRRGKGRDDHHSYLL